MPDFDNSAQLRDMGKPVKRIMREETGNAGKDGYTTVARRVRGDLPGYLTDVGEADKYDQMMAEFEDGGGPIGPSY